MHLCLAASSNVHGKRPLGEGRQADAGFTVAPGRQKSTFGQEGAVSPRKYPKLALWVARQPAGAIARTLAHQLARGGPGSIAPERSEIQCLGGLNNAAIRSARESEGACLDLPTCDRDRARVRPVTE